MSALNYRYTKALLLAALFLCVPLWLWAFSSDPPTGNTGAPGENRCQTCHAMTGAGGGNVRITFSGGGTTYTPGVQQALTINVTDTNSGTSAYGFELTATEGSIATTPGTFAPASANVDAPRTSSGKVYEANASTASPTFNVNWTPPASSVYSGPVIFYVASVAGNGALSGADSLYQTNATLTAATTATLSASPSSLSFSYTQKGTVPAAQNISLTSSGSALSYTVATATTSGGNWLSATPASGTTPGTEGVSVNPTALTPGTYSGTVTFTSSGASNSPVHVPVTLTVTAAPNLMVAPSALTFNYQIGGTSPAAQTVSVGSTGAALSYTASATTTTGGNWLSVTPASSTTPGTESVTVNTTGLTAGTYMGSVSIASTGAGNSPQAVAVTLNVTSAAVPNLTVTPTSLSFHFQIGGTSPAAQTVSVGSTGAALNYTASATTTTGGNWLSVTPASSTTPGTESVTVNTTGLTAGTYMGSVSIASTGAGNSPQAVAVTLNVTSAAVPNLTVTPTSLSFHFQIGGTSPAAQTVSVGSTGAALNYTASATTTTGGNWLSVTPASSTTPGTESVTVNTTGLTAGTYMGSVSIASTGTGNSPLAVPVTLVVSSAGTGTLRISPRRLTFSYVIDSEIEIEDDGLRQRLTVTSIGSPLTYTATALGGSWLSVGPSTGTTPSRITVSVDPRGLAVGTYTGQVEVAANGANTVMVPVSLNITSARGEGDGSGRVFATTFTSDPNDTGAVSAQWVYGAGVPANDPKDTTNQGLVLVNNAGSLSQARAGIILHSVSGLTLNELGFDMRKGSLCTSSGPHFLIVTDDGVLHTLGCTAANLQPAPASGWDRLLFDPQQATPAVTPGSTVKSIALMLDDGPEASGGMVVLDNININHTFIGKE